MRNCRLFLLALALLGGGCAGRQHANSERLPASVLRADAQERANLDESITITEEIPNLPPKAGSTGHDSVGDLGTWRSSDSRESTTFRDNPPGAHSPDSFSSNEGMSGGMGSVLKPIDQGVGGFPQRFDAGNEGPLSAKANLSSQSVSQTIDGILRDLERVDPSKVAEFIAATRDASAASNLEQVLATWRTTVDYLMRAKLSQDPTVVIPSYSQNDRRSSPSTIPVSATVGVTDELAVRPAATTYDSRAQSLPTIPQAMAPTRPTPTERLTYQASTSPLSQPVSATNNPVNPIQQTTAVRREPEPLNVRLEQLARELDTLEAGNPNAQLRSQVYSRLLQTMAGDRGGALRPIASADLVDRDFWKNQLWAMTQYFDENNIPQSEHRAQACIEALQEAIGALQQRADLEISTPILCRRVTNFGNYEEFEKYEFEPGQAIVVYWEVKNFASSESKEGFRTKMAATFEIHDSGGAKRHQFERSFKDDLCRNRRHDYFNAVVFELPKDLPTGEYVLKVTAHDKTTEKIAQKQRRLTIK